MALAGQRYEVIELGLPDVQEEVHLLLTGRRCSVHSDHLVRGDAHKEGRDGEVLSSSWEHA